MAWIRQSLRTTPASRLIVAALFTLITVTSHVAPVRADSAASQPADPQQQLEQALTQLTAEAESLDEIGDEEARPVFRRPHPALREGSSELALLALERMQRDFTGNPYRDTYIRWHLLWAAKQVMREQLNRYMEVGEHELPSGIAQRLATLLRDMPEPIQRERREEVRREPEEVWQRYIQARNELWRVSTVRVGYPPFDRVYRGRAALPHIPENRREEIAAQVEQLEARMEQLRPHFRTVVDHEARAYNNRIEQMNLILRQYRGELIYTLIQTGDEALFLRAIEVIGEQVRQGQWAAIDLMRYMYLAAMDGYLLLYEDATYERAARQLRRIAESNDEYRAYRFGDRPPPRHYHPAVRNFAEYAFHMVHMLQDPGIFQWFHESVTLPDEQPPARRGDDFQFTGYNFTMDDVRAARERAVRTIYQGRGNRRLLPSYDLQQSRMEALRGVSRNHVRFQELTHEYGNHALVNWALMASGETYQDPRLFHRINWVLSSDTPFTFDRGMRLQMLAQMPAQRWRPWIQRDLRWVTNALSDKGNWPYQYTGGDFTGWGDHANGAYGVLGLWAAQQAGVDVPLSVWEAVDRHWRQTQQSTPDDQPAGWAVGMFNVDQSENADDVQSAFYRRVNGPMTATGVSTLTLTERYLYGTEQTNPDQQNVSRHLRKGIAWLDQHFTLDTGNDPSADWFYYMWTMQRVGRATGYRTFNGVDWFRDVTAEMLNRQRPDGLWEDPTGRQGTLVSTGFALLYLSNAYDPIGISKLRFDGEWNNRPHDLLNFVDYASDQYQRDTGWQIVTLDQPVYQLIESPLLYLATDDRFELSDAHVQRLREYIEAGGMLVLNPDRSNNSVARAFNDLIERLYPERELEDVPNDHLIYRIHRRLRPSVRMRMIHNGVRPLVVQFVRDIGEDLQANRIGRSDSFTVLSNLYLYAIGLNPRRTRLETSYIVPEHAGAPSGSIRLARLAHAGTHDPEPGALAQLQAFMREEHDIQVEYETIDPLALSEQPLAMLTTLGDAELSDEQVEAIRRWLEGGGTLWLDAAGGSQAAVANARSLLERIVPDRAPRPLTATSAILSGDGLIGGYDNRRVQFRYYALREMGPVTTPRLQTVEIDDRPAIIFSPEDITTGLAGLQHWGIFGYSVPSARRLVANSVLQSLNQ